MKKASKKCNKKTKYVLTFQITRDRKAAQVTLPIFTPKMKKTLRTAGELPDPPDPVDPPETRQGAWCTTPGTLAPEVRMTVVLNKLPQITTRMVQLPVLGTCRVDMWCPGCDDQDTSICVGQLGLLCSQQHVTHAFIIHDPFIV